MWRLFWTDPDTGLFLEYPDVPDVSPGIAYWLITRDGGTLDVTGMPVTDEMFPIVIPPGWFQLGNPYNADVSKDDLRVEITETATTSLLPSLEEANRRDTSESGGMGPLTQTATVSLTVPLSDPRSPIDDALWHWDFSTDAYIAVDTMVPWGGWLIYNRGDNPATLLISNPAVGPGPGAGSLQVTVQDALTGNEVVGATVTLNGFTATTDDLGVATIPDTPTGTFTLTISMPGYSTYQQEITLEVGPNDLIVNLSPQLAEGQIRIVLTWGENPRDLDSHLVGPDAAGGRFHVYYANRNPAGAGANLDVDDVSSFGPETITITEVHIGTYSYYVDWFSGTGTWAQSGARVEVY
jgi:hypothetical protein